MSDAYEVLQLIVMLISIGCVVGGAVWTVATMRQIVTQLVESVGELRQGVGKLRSSVTQLTTSVDGLSGRVDELETDHRETQQRIAALEQGQH